MPVVSPVKTQVTEDPVSEVEQAAGGATTGDDATVKPVRMHEVLVALRRLAYRSGALAAVRLPVAVIAAKSPAAGQAKLDSAGDGREHSRYDGPAGTAPDSAAAAAAGSLSRLSKKTLARSIAG